MIRMYIRTWSRGDHYGADLYIEYNKVYNAKYGYAEAEVDCCNSCICTFGASFEYMSQESESESESSPDFDRISFILL
jgi:hypothetical protein